MNEFTLAVGGGVIITLISFFVGNGIQQSIGVALVAIPSLLLFIDLLGFGQYQTELEKLTSGGLWVHELEALTGQDLDGDQEVGDND